LIKNIILEKHQRKLIKYFKNNVISTTPPPPSKSKQDSFLLDVACLNKLLNKAELSETDKKVLKGLVDSYDFKKNVLPAIEGFS